jgi:vanillate O-demethylase ferredoxin subunit
MNVSQIVGDSLAVTVSKKKLIADGVMYLEFIDPSGGDLPEFSAGAHIEIQLPNGLIRPYSLCGSSAVRTSYELAVLLEPNGRGGSKSVHEEIILGAKLRISYPKNHFPLAVANHSILFAGGIGITPILAMAEKLSDEGRSFDMHYCSRTPSRTAFIDRIQAAPFSSKVQFHFDDGVEEQKLKASEILKNTDPATHIYVCGPKGFMDHVIQTAKDLNWPDSQIHFEYFKSEPIKKDDDGSFEVEYRPSGLVVRVPADMTVAQALIDAGVEIPLSCEQGICGTCVMQVIDGNPDHRDVCLSDEDKDSKKMFTPCCSRAQSARLVLDHQS